MAEKMGCVSETRRRWTHTMEWMAFAGRLWQRNDYEPIIGNEESLNRIHPYILDTPARWVFDREDPSATFPEPESTW